MILSKNSNLEDPFGFYLNLKIAYLHIWDGT